MSLIVPAEHSDCHILSMWSIVVPIIGIVSLLAYFVVLPVIAYFRDAKEFRKYPNLNAISGFSDLGFMWEAAQGFRSKTLYELHKTSPIVRIGPNSLSYGDPSAIKVNASVLLLRKNDS